MTLKRKLIIALIVVAVGIQFFQGSKANPESNTELDFIYITQPPEDVVHLIKLACYDCHSYHTQHPWYSYISPVSWLITHDVNEAREHLNFSEWGSYTSKKANHKLEECQEEVEEGEMPMKIYTIMHPEADLTQEQRALLEEWFRSQR